MVDPGIGFAKDLHQNLLLMNNLELLHKWDLPILLGTSRKSMIGLTLDLPVTTKGNGTFMVQVYDLENAPFENGADRWEHRVTVEVDNLAVYAKKAMDTATK